MLDAFDPGLRNARRQFVKGLQRSRQSAGNECGDAAPTILGIRPVPEDIVGSLMVADSRRGSGEAFTIGDGKPAFDLARHNRRSSSSTATTGLPGWI
jgi:hypothetical protein